MIERGMGASPSTIESGADEGKGPGDLSPNGVSSPMDAHLVREVR